MRALPLLLLILPAPAGAQTLLDTGYHQMYDLDFDGAHRSFERWIVQHPDDAMGPVSDAAAYLFAEFDRLHILQSEFFLHDTFLKVKPLPDPKVKVLFEASAEKGRAAAEATLARDPRNAGAQLASAIRYGLRADYSGLIEKRYLASLSEMKAGRAIAESLIAAHPDLGDAYLAVGVENYVLSQKAAPVRFLLRMGGAQTDYERGVRDVSLTAERGHYLAPYARVLLAVAALRDNNTARARTLLQGLVAEYPHNPLYAQELARLRQGSS
ncbi:MAG TPA: hypothetical protein VEF06_15285 [Bryobacteraceae bacterium]|nr:hypothetical protein [Bryobacteraceae bacterium]